VIEPTEADIGRAVVYRARPDAAPEDGVLTSWNERGVFVRYTTGPCASPQPLSTPFHRLAWDGPRVECEPSADAMAAACCASCSTPAACWNGAPGRLEP
jgi:hypothetical protein